MLRPLNSMHLAYASKKWSALLYGVICHVAFVGGVGSMIVEMFFGMSRSFGSLPHPFASVANALLLAQFPVAHSWLLTTRGRRALSVLAPRAMGRDLASTLYATIAALQVGSLFLLWTPSGIVWWTATGWAFHVLTSLYALAWLLLLKSIVDAGFKHQVGMLGWWALWRGVPVVYPGMPQNGLFRFVRQPIYVSFALTLWLTSTWTPDQLIVAIVLTSYCLVGPLFKERRFSRLFGSEFLCYQRSVPYWLPWWKPTRLQQDSPAVLNDQSLYQDHAAEWWTGRRRWLRTLHNLVPARMQAFDACTPRWSGLDVLDVGCGGGFLAEELARRGARVTGIDPSAGAIEVARSHAEQNGLSIAYEVAAGEAIPAADRAFDVVVCVDVLEHVSDLARVLSEARRVLRPGGRFLFDTINKTPMATFVIVTLGEYVLRLVPRGTHDPSMFIPPASLRALLKSEGFDDVVIQGLGPRGLNRRGDLTFGRFPTMSVMYIGSASLPLDLDNR